MKPNPLLRQEVIDHCANRGYKLSTIKGVVSFNNAIVREGVEFINEGLKEHELVPFALSDSGRVYGYDETGNETRDIFNYLENERNKAIQSNLPVPLPIPDKPVNGFGNDYFQGNQLTTNELSYNTFEALLLLQNTKPDFIESRKGYKGKMLKYVSGAYMTNALNFAFKFKWSSNVMNTREDTVIVDKIELKMFSALVQLTAIIVDPETLTETTVMKEQWGSCILRENMEVGDCLKSAVTDALKKCASLFGIALDVYGLKSEIE